MNFYRKMNHKLNQAGIDSFYIINGHAQLGKRFKPLLVKLVNHLCAVAELRRKSYGVEILNFRSSLDHNSEYGWTKLSVYVINEEGEEIFDFTSVASGQRSYWYMFKYLLKQFNRWLNAFA